MSLLVLKELVQAMSLHDLLRLIGEEHSVTIKRYPQLVLRHLQVFAGAEDGGCSNPCGGEV